MPVAFIRKVKTKSGTTAVQIAHSQEQFTVNPVILVGQNLKELVILEGHFRLVALLLQEVPPQMIPAIIGLSDNISEWALY